MNRLRMAKRDQNEAMFDKTEITSNKFQKNSGLDSQGKQWTREGDLEGLELCETGRID